MHQLKMVRLASAFGAFMHTRGSGWQVEYTIKLIKSIISLLHSSLCMYVGNLPLNIVILNTRRRAQSFEKTQYEGTSRT